MIKHIFNKLNVLMSGQGRLKLVSTATPTGKYLIRIDQHYGYYKANAAFFDEGEGYDTKFDYCTFTNLEEFVKDIVFQAKINRLAKHIIACPYEIRTQVHEALLKYNEVVPGEKLKSVPETIRLHNEELRHVMPFKEDIPEAVLDMVVHELDRNAAYIRFMTTGKQPLKANIQLSN